MFGKGAFFVRNAGFDGVILKKKCSKETYWNGLLLL